LAHATSSIRNKRRVLKLLRNPTEELRLLGVSSAVELINLCLVLGGDDGPL